MTIRYRFSNSDMLTAAGVAMRPLKVDDKGALFEHVGQPGITERLSHEDLAQIMRRPDTTYYLGYFDRAAQELRSRAPVGFLNEVHDQIRALVIWRKAFCDAFLSLEAGKSIRRTHESYQRVQAKLAAETQRLAGEGEAALGPLRPGAEIRFRKLPKSRTAFEWVRRYEKAGYSALALIPETHRSGNREPRWCYRSEALMNQVIELYCDTQQPTKAQAVLDTRGLFAE